MLTMRVIPLTVVHCTLDALIPIVGHNYLNQVDKLSIPPLAKLAELVDNLLSDDVTYEHVYQAFWIECPVTILTDLLAFNKGITFDVRSEQFMVKGMMSASFAIVREIIRESVHGNDVFKAFGQQLLISMKTYSYFKK